MGGFLGTKEFIGGIFLGEKITLSPWKCFLYGKIFWDCEGYVHMFLGEKLTLSARRFSRERRSAALRTSFWSPGLIIIMMVMHVTMVMMMMYLTMVMKMMTMATMMTL